MGKVDFKSRDLALLNEDTVKAQMKVDAREALQKYGETLNIRRSTLQPLLLGGSEVQVLRVYLIYEGGALKPTWALGAAMRETEAAIPGVEVIFR